MCLRIRDNHRKSIHIYTDDDSQGQQLTGQDSYAITFARGELPPVKGFWSLTLYDAVHFFHPNPLNRYSLGTKEQDPQIQRGRFADALWRQHIARQDKESNWLPAPEGAFSLYIRAYWADEPVLDGQWKPPVVARVQQAQLIVRDDESACVQMIWGER
jgi:hypothetical protein